MSYTAAGHQGATQMISLLFIQLSCRPSCLLCVVYVFVFPSPAWSIASCTVRYVHSSVDPSVTAWSRSRSLVCRGSVGGTEVVRPVSPPPRL